MGKRLLRIPVWIILWLPAIIWGQCPSSVAISADTGNTICQDTNVTFTANTNGGSGTFSYQWQVNNASVGSNSTANTFSTATLNNGDKVRVIVTTDADPGGCSTSSNQITMTVNTNRTPTVSLSSSPTTKCIGENVTFTASNTHGGNNPQYAWYVNSNTTASQTSTSNTFSINSLPAGANSVRVVMTSNLTCVTSATAETTANITITDDASIGTPGNKDQSDVCINSAIAPIVFAIGGSGSGATVTGLPPGVTGSYNSGNFTISGLPTSSGTFGYTVTATGPCDSSTESGTIIVVEDATISLTSGNNNQTVCQDQAIANITYNIGETGNNATVTGLPTGISGSFSGGIYTISGSSSVTGTHNYTINATGTCGDSSNLTGSIIINENLTPAVSITSSDADNVICQGEEVTFTATPSNGGTNPSYQWKIGSTNVGTNSNTFTTNTLAVGDQSVSVVITSNETCLSQTTATSNTIVTTVNQNLTPDVSITASDSDICDGDTVEFSVETIANAGTNPTYQWKLDGVNVGSNSNTYSTSNLTNGQVVSLEITSDATCLTTTTATSNEIVTTVNPNLTPEVSIVSDDPNNIICAGSSVTFTATPINGGNSPSYEWFIDGSSVGNNSSTFSTTGLSNGQIVKVVMTSDEECLATTTAESNEISIQVDNSITSITPALDTTNPTHNPTAVCPVVTGLIYKIQDIAGATSYNWNFPSGWNITAGAGTSQVTVTATSSAQAGTFQVSASNECGSSNTFTSDTMTPGTVVYVSAGPDQTVCRGTTQINLAGEIGGVITKSQHWDWSANVTGGSFSNGGNNLNGTYTIPTSIRNSGGTVIIKITSIDPAGPCGPKEDEMVLTVLTNATISNPGNKNQTVCINTAIADINFTIANAGTGANTTGLPAGLSGTYNSGIYTISGTPTESGTFNYTVTTTGSCTSQQTSQSGIITVSPDQTIDDPANKSQETCINESINNIVFSTNASVTNASVSGLPAGITGSFSAGSFTISGAPTEAGSFEYTVTTSGNCVNTTQMGIITVNPDPTIDSPTNKNQEICINTPLENIQFNLTAPATDASVNGLPAGISGSYNNGVFTLSGSPTEAGTFDYTVSSISDCSDVSETGQIIVNPDPTAAIEYIVDFCTSQSGTISVNLTGTGDYENGNFYSSPSGLSLDAATGEITPSTSTPGTYTVSYDTASDCASYTAVTTVVINELPSVEISYEGPFCTSDATSYSVTFSNAVGAYENGTFSSTPGGLDIDANTGAISPQTSSPNTNPYTVFYTIPAANGCDEVIVETQVIITQLPQVSISYDSPLCTSDTNLYAVSYSSTAGDYTGGSFSGTEGLDIDANGNISPVNSVPGTHTITYSKDSDADGCPIVEATTEIQIFEQIQITTQPENYGTCSSNSASFEVIATGDNLVYQWYKKDSGGSFVQINGETNSTLSFNNATSADAGEYQVIVSSSNGACSAVTSDPVTLNIDEEIIITKPAEDITICEDDYESLSFEYEAHANGAPLMFQWIKDGNPINPTSGKYVMTEIGPTGTDGVYTGTLTIENIDVTDDGVYAVEIDGPDYFTCPSATSKTFTFRVNPRPASPGTTDIEYCLNDTAEELTASKDSNDNELLWYSYDGTTGEYTYLGTNITPITDTPGDTSYWVSQRQPNGCESDPAELVVTINDKPNPVSTETIEFSYCFNETVSGPVSVTPDTGSTINWYDAVDATTPLSSAPTPITSSAAVTSYWVSQTLTSTGCESDRTKVDIIVNPLPEIQINIADGFSSEICLNTDTRLVASGATDYTWYFDGNEIGTGDEITITGDSVGSFEYEVTGTDANGCTNTDIFTIIVEEPSNGGVTTGPESVCITQNSGTITVSDYTGDIQRWESSTDGVNWTTISETTENLNFQNISGNTSFRAIVKNGVCDEVASSEISIGVDQEPQAGGVMFSGTDRVFMMCEFPTAEYLVPLQLTGTYVGEIVAWQYRRNSQTSWNNIQENGSNYTGNSLSGAQVNAASNNESTLFRVEVQSGACTPNVYSDFATLSVIPSDIAPSPVQITPGEVCLGEIVSMSSATGYGGSGTFEGGAFDNSSIANHGWRVMRYGNSNNGTEYTFESAADNIRPDRWMRTNPHDYQMAHPSGNGSIIYQRFDSCSCDAGNKGFAIVSGNNPSTLETPVFNLFTMDNPILTFDQAYNLTYGDTIRVEISLDGGNTYNEEPLMEIGGPPNPGDPPTVSGNYAFFGDDGLGPPNNMEIDLSNYAGLSNLRIRWLYDGTTGGIYTIDDIGLPEDPQNVQLIWYYDEDINDDTNTLEQIGEVNQSTVTYPQNGAEWPKIGWNDFEVQTALVFDTNGDPCESAENSAVASVYVFDNYTSTATAQVGQCGNTDVQLSATITGVFQGEITEFPEGEGSTLAWEVVTAPDGYTFSEDHFVNSDTNIDPITDPNAIFQPPVEGNYTLRYTITPNASQTTRNILGDMVTQDISANPCPMTHVDTQFEFIDCTTLDFDGDDDYIDLGNNYNGNYFIEAWIRPFDRPVDGGGTTDASTGVIFSSSGMEIRMENLPAGVVKNGRWYHIAVANNGDLWVDGVSSGNIDISGSGINNTSIGARYNANTKTTSNHFSGWIEELRIWNTTPTQKQIRFMMNQRILLDGSGTVVSPLQGEVVPNLVIADGGLSSYHTDGTNNLDQDDTPFYNLTAANLAGYYRLYSDNPDPANLIPGYFDPALEPSGGYTPDHSINKVPGRMYNITTDQENTSPTPYFSGTNGTWANSSTWARPSVWDYPNSTYNNTDINWNIARVNHNITSDNKEITMLGLLSETPGTLLSINGNHPIRITHYLLLNGNMDLVNESQLLQDHGSILDNTSSGWAEIDQAGRMSSYNYNYWTSPFSTQGVNNNGGFEVRDVLMDGSNPNSPQAINFQDGYFVADGAKTTPITISNYWIWDFRGGDADIYGDWLYLGSDYPEIVGAGFTMKGTTGSASLTATQNYVFRGKPNNGNIPTTELYLQNNQNFLVGNPYPSAIDADEFLRDNLTNVGTGSGNNENGQNVFNGTLYFWDHFAGYTHILEEYVGGYATYNLIGSAPAISNDWRINTGGGANNVHPKQYIPVAQGFFLNSAPVSGQNFSGDIIFNNTQRVYKTLGAESVFLQQEEDIVKGKPNKNSSEDTRMKIRVKFESPKGYYRQILVASDPNTSSGFDIGYDAPLIENNVEDMYWWFEDHGFVIQGVPDFEKERTLPIAIKTNAGGEFTIKIDETENWPVDKELYLKDKLLDTVHDILKQDYIGQTESAGEITDRFEIVFFKEQAEDPVDEDPVVENPVDLDPDDVLNPDLPIVDGLVGISYSTFSKQVKIDNFDLLDVQKVMIFDLGGKLIQEFDELPTEREIRLGMKPVRSAVYIVKVFSEKGISNKKIIVK